MPRQHSCEERAYRSHRALLARRSKAAVLLAQRGVLGEEPPRPFDGQATVKMGGPEMAPHTPPMFGAPRGTRGAPLYTAYRYIPRLTISRLTFRSSRIRRSRARSPVVSAPR